MFGTALLWAVWAVLVWFLLTYGNSVVRMTHLEWPLARAWLVALAIDAALQWRPVLLTFLSSAWCEYIADEGWYTTQHAWFERYLDSGSVLASLGDGETRASLGTYAEAHAQLFAGVDE
jgi:hypothetical protein